MAGERKLDDQIRATDKRAARWQRLADTFKIVQEWDGLTDAALAKRGGWLDREAVTLKRRFDEEMGRRDERAAAARHNRDKTRRILTKLRYEIDEDLAAGRLTEPEHESASERIAASLADLDRPLEPGQTVRVVGIPNKKIDTEALAEMLFNRALRQVREQKGLPPLTAEEERQQRVLSVQARAERKRRRREEELQSQAEEQRMREKALKHLRDKRPAQLRQETWDWLIDQGLDELPADQRFGPLVYSLGGLTQPHLLQNTVIQLEDGTDYVISPGAAGDLAGSAETTTLVRLGDRERVSLPYASVVWGISEGPVFDQLDL